MIKVILTVLLISNFAFAEDAPYLEKGDPAPKAGYLVSPPKAKSLYNDAIELDMRRRIDPLKDQQIKLLDTQNTKLATALESTSSVSTWTKIGYFAGGVIITGLAVKLAHDIYLPR